MRVPQMVEKAFQAALKARSHSYSPYSRFKVGAALKVASVDDSIVGCNVENASYGATICAERVALHRAVATLGRFQPDFMVIVTAEKKATVPCALCLQSMAEFCGDGFTVYLGNERRLLKRYRLRELLPKPFRSFAQDRK